VTRDAKHLSAAAGAYSFAMSAIRRALVPEDLVYQNGNAARKNFHRTCAALALGTLNKEPADAIVKRSWPDDPRCAVLTRAASTPTATGGPLSQVKVGDLLLVAPGSAAARLFQRCLQLDFSGGIYEFRIPFVGAHPQPLFVPEGGAAPVVQANFGSATVGPVKKLMFIATLSRELERANPESAAAIIGRMLSEAAAKSLDAHVFDNQPADATRPAGLLNGVAALTAQASGGTSIDTIAADVATFAGAFSAANINSENMVLIAHPVQSWKLRMVLGYQLDFPILSSIALTPGSVVAVVPEAVASGFEGAPEIESGEYYSTGAAHFEDTSPAEIVNSSGVPASPTYSTFQKDLFAVRVKIRCAWAVVQPGATQFMSGVNW
jgi:Phage capsid family